MIAQELLVVFEPVALDHGDIGVFRRKLLQRLFRRRSFDHDRGRVGGEFEQEIGGVELAVAPGNLRPLRLLVHVDADLGQHVVDIDAALSQQTRQRFGVNAIVAAVVDADRARRGVEGDDRIGLGIDQRQTARERVALLRVGVGPRAIDHDDTGQTRRRRQRVREVGQFDRLDRRVAGARDARIDRREIIVAGILKGAAGEIDEGLHVGTSGIGLVEEVAQRFAHRLLVEVARAHDVEAGGLQHLRH